MRVLNRQNNFGLLRLVLAALVLISHSAELIDGNRSREPLTAVFGTLSFGETGVAGFFLISGYLITRSFHERPAAVGYVARRALRLLPGYVVSFWICLLAMTPLLKPHADMGFEIRRNLINCLYLLPPDVEGILGGLPHPMLNGSMWTIAYEARCYVAVLVLGLMGRRLGLRLTSGRWVVAALVALAVAARETGAFAGAGVRYEGLLGRPEVDVGFLATFGVGTLFYLFRDRLPLGRAGASISLAGLCVALSFRPSAALGFDLFGGYLILYAAWHLAPVRMPLASETVDISYGLYLYAWPIQTLIIWFDRPTSPGVLSLLALTGAALAGAASWFLIERPCARRGAACFARRISPEASRPAVAAPASALPGRRRGPAPARRCPPARGP